jgi:hypothetical protein
MLTEQAAGKGGLLSPRRHDDVQHLQWEVPRVSWQLAVLGASWQC